MCMYVCMFVCMRVCVRSSTYRWPTEWGQPWKPKWRLCAPINWSINVNWLDNIKIYLKINGINNGTDSSGTWQGPRALSARCHLYISASPLVSSSEYGNSHVPVKVRADISQCFRATPVRARCGHEQMPLTFRHRASCILGEAFHYSPQNAFYIFNQWIYFIIWYLLDRASLI